MTESQNIRSHSDGITVEDFKSRYGGSSIGSEMVMVGGFMKVMKPLCPMKMQCLYLSLCLDGECRFTVDTVEHTVRPYDIVIVGDGQTVSGVCESVGYRSIGLAMSYDFFNELVKGVRGLSSLFLFAKSHPVYRLTPDEADSIIEYYTLIRRKADNSGHKFRRETVQLLIATMICDISNVVERILSSGKPNKRGEQIFMNFIKLVELHFRHERRVAWYAEALCLSPKYLSEAVKGISRRTPNEWIDYYVMLELRVLLRNTAYSVKEIALRMNFSSQSFLGKYFKEHTGMSPMEYRMEKCKF